MRTQTIATLLLVMVVMSSSPCYPEPGEEAHGRNTSKSIQITRILRPGGWDIPAIDTTQVTQPRERFSLDNAPQLVVYRTSRARPEAQNFQQLVLVELPFYFLQPSTNTLINENVPVSVDAIHVYDMEGRIFCYRVMTTQYNPDTRTGGGGFGPAWNIHYYDMDGDGKFETMEFITTAAWTLVIPEWVKSDKSR